MEISRTKVWDIIESKTTNPSNVYACVKLKGDVCEVTDKNLYTYLSEPTKNFIRELASNYKKRKDKTFGDILKGKRDIAPYGFALKAALFAEKLEEGDKAKFKRELDWDKLGEDKVFAWVQELCREVK